MISQLAAPSTTVCKAMIGQVSGECFKAYKWRAMMDGGEI